MSGSICPITIQREAVTNYISDNLQGYRLQVTCTDSQCSGTAIFVYLAKMIDPVAGDMILEFQSVASAGDIAEYPEYVAGDTLEVGEFYRTSEVDLIFRSRDLLQDTWEAIKSDVGLLAHTLSYAQDENLNSMEQIIITDFVTPYTGSIDVRSGGIFGNGGDTYSVTFAPAFNTPPIVTATATAELQVWVDTVTASSVIFKTSIPISDSVILNWIAVG